MAEFCRSAEIESRFSIPVAHLQTITLQSWIEDFRFLLKGVLAGGTEDAQQARLEDHLEVRYAPHLLVQAYSTLKYSYNWMARHWEYLGEVGLVRRKDGKVEVVNCTMLALHEVAFSMEVENLPQIPDIDPRKLVAVAQRYIDAEKAAEQDVRDNLGNAPRDRET